MWYFAGLLAAGATALIGRGVYRRRHQHLAARAAGLAPCADLSHLPVALQHTALWRLADGGFERRPAHAQMSRRARDLDVTAFDLETLRERRGEWASLAVEPPFRIGPLVSVVVCELALARPLAHAIAKCAGLGDDMLDDPLLERLPSPHKLARDALQISRTYAVEPPPPILPTPRAIAALPDPWRAYTSDANADELAALVGNGLGAALAAANRRDLVVELLDELVVVYPAAAEVVGPDAFADLVATAIAIAEGVLAASPALSPRGIEPTLSPG